MKHQVPGAIALALAVVVGATTANATFTCESVAVRGENDPDGDPFTNKFDEPVATNMAGDALFVGRAGTKQQNLYLYDAANMGTIIARVGDPAPGGSTFARFGKGCFGHLALNDLAATGAFTAKLAIGEGVFVLDAGTLEKAAQTTDASPAGGTFLTFPSMSDINDDNEVNFVATVAGGPSGVFQYDADTGAVTPIVVAGDLDVNGNPFCSFETVGPSTLGQPGVLAPYVATVGIPDCANPVQGVFYTFDLLGISHVVIAYAGDATPIGGTTFDSFLNAPEFNGGLITFAANVSGAPFTGAGIFSFDGITITKVAAYADAAPDVGGSLAKLGGQHRLATNDDVFARWFTRQTTAGHALFLFGGSPEAAVAKTDAPPSPPFGASASYRFLGQPDIAEDGSILATRARVKDSFAPSAKNAILRCVP